MSRARFSEYSKILGLVGSFSIDEVKAAYRREMLVWHPDRHQHPDSIQEASVKSKKLNEAFEYLSELTEGGEIFSTTSKETSRQETHRTQHKYQNQKFKPGFPDKSVTEVFVKSSWIVSSGYQRQTKTMYVKIKGGGIFVYSNVPDSVFHELINAESVGKFFHNKLKSYHHTYTTEWR